MLKRAVVLIVANAAVACGIITGAEVIGQVAFRVKNGEFLFQQRSPISPYRKLFEMHPFLVGRLRAGASVEHGGVTITATEGHTRWTGAPDPEDGCTRIAIIGGSTAFGTKVSDRDSWAAQLQAKLGPDHCVRNYGMPGYSTAEGIIQMALVVPEFRPDLVIVYEGWNDISDYHDPGLGPDYFSHGMRQSTNLGLQDPPLSISIWRRSAIARLIRAARTRLGLVRQREARAGSAAPDPFVDRLYVRNLETIAMLARRFGARTLFVPQVLNDSYFEGHGGTDDWSPRIENSAMPALMTRFNKLMESVCNSARDDCAFIGGVLAADWRPDDFVDQGHFSRAGGNRFSEVLKLAVQAELSEQHGAPSDKS